MTPDEVKSDVGHGARSEKRRHVSWIEEWCISPNGLGWYSAECGQASVVQLLIFIANVAST